MTAAGVILYRSMQRAADGFPLTGPTARTLGTRLNVDLVVNPVSIQKDRLYEAFDEALHAGTPSAQLAAVIAELLAAGYARDTLYAALERFVVMDLRPSNRDRDEEIVFEVMDRLSGWCAPGVKL